MKAYQAKGPGSVRSRIDRILPLLVLPLLAVPAGAAAQGWIEPQDGRRGQAVVRVETDVDVRVEAGIAHVEVTDWFENRGSGLAEGVYLYPLPSGAVFGSFSLWQGEEELRGEVMDAREAREIYQSIVRRLADPALVELVGAGLLRARVFPFQPGETRRVTLRYTQVLERSGDALRFRYHAGVGAGAPEGTSEGPSAPAAPLRLRVEAEEGSRFLEPFSPTHPLRHRRAGERLVVEAEGEVRGRMSVFLPLAETEVALSMATHRVPGEDGYFMLTLSPAAAQASFEPRDVTVVLDVSGSMSGEKIRQARDAVIDLLGTLSPRDRFRLIAFSSRVRPESEGWRPADPEALREARAWVADLRADGGTDIQGALDEALRLESPAGRLPLVVFVTDGLPTVGERSPDRIAERVAGARGRTRIFAVGVGHDVDTNLLDALSEAARGTTTYVEPGEDVGRAVELLAARVRHPVLTDLALGEAPVRLREVYPVTLPDLFAGEALALFGRWEGAGDGELRLTGRRGGEALAFRVQAAFPRTEAGNEFIPRLWAMRKLGHLSRQVRLEGSSPELDEEIRRTALRYGLPSEHTSWLVLEPGVTVDGVGGRRTGGVAPPAGAVPAAPRSGPEAVRAAVGQARMRAVRSEADLAEMERGAAAADAQRDDARRVAGRLFRAEDGVWTETRPAGQGAGGRTVAVALFSQAWFDLLSALPELVPMARALERFEVLGEAVTLRFVEEGRRSIAAAELQALVREFRGTGR